MDEARFAGPKIKCLWNAMSVRMHALLPHASAAMVKTLHEANVRGRLYSTLGDTVVSQTTCFSTMSVSLQHIRALPTPIFGTWNGRLRLR